MLEYFLMLCCAYVGFFWLLINLRSFRNRLRDKKGTIFYYGAELFFRVSLTALTYGLPLAMLHYAYMYTRHL